MSKVKSALLSLGARGTIGDAITYQERGRVAFVRTKPIPAYHQTLLQLYQRWDYEDYAYLWRQQSEATRQEYASAGVRFHLTGFQYWMRYHLRNLPDLMGRWHLDEKAGAVAMDSSKQGNNGIIFGASPADGLIGGAYSFDGLNDWINCGIGTTLNFTTGDFTLEAFVYLTDLTSTRFIFNRGHFANDNYCLNVNSVGYLNFFNVTGGVRRDTRTANGSLVTGQWYHLAAVRIGNTVWLYKDGVDFTIVHGNHLDPIPKVANFEIGVHNVVNWPMWGIIDHSAAYNRFLDTTELLRHAGRRAQ